MSEKNVDNIIEFPQPKAEEEIVQLEEKEEITENAENQSKPKKKEPKKGHKLRRLFVILVLFLAILIGGISYFCPIEKINVKGTAYYTDQQIINALKKDHYINNSVFLMIKNRISPIETMPFVDKIDIQIENRNTITVKVHDSLRAGCIKYARKYIYFDKKGKALEVMDKRLEEVPLVTGLKYDHIVIGKTLKVKDKERLAQIVKITTLITKNELTINEIVFRSDDSVRLVRGQITIDLGEPVNLDAKLSVLPNVLNSLEGQRGILNLSEYTEDAKVITFKKK
ncbi:MAG: FtsQ-type POTRA domain-containing protein [Lachnospiraceae bacterium]|nr:FtsQ-type POTRA domain-containing protein [Lachnospiraceae bacterium]